jgi:hypothetical protein
MKGTHHSPRIVLANIPAPSWGIGSTSTHRELRTNSENSPRCVGEKADTTSVKSPSDTNCQHDLIAQDCTKRTGKVGV